MKSTKVKITTTIAYDLHKKLEREHLDRKITMNSIIQMALEAYFDPNKQEERDAILTRSLKNVKNEVAVLAQDQKILGTMLDVFIQTWLQYNPELPEEQKQAVAPQAAKRYNMFLELIAKNVASSKTLYDTLPPVAFVKAEDFTTQPNQQG